MNLTLLSKKELLHELFAANAQFLLCLKNAAFDESQKEYARTYLNDVLREVETRRTMTSHFSMAASS
jgi:hypothetical protein